MTEINEDIKTNPNTDALIPFSLNTINAVDFAKHCGNESPLFFNDQLQQGDQLFLTTRTQTIVLNNCHFCERCHNEGKTTYLLTQCFLIQHCLFIKEIKITGVPFTFSLCKQSTEGILEPLETLETLSPDIWYSIGSVKNEEKIDIGSDENSPLYKKISVNLVRQFLKSIGSPIKFKGMDIWENEKIWVRFDGYFDRNESPHLFITYNDIFRQRVANDEGTFLIENMKMCSSHKKDRQDFKEDRKYFIKGENIIGKLKEELRVTKKKKEYYEDLARTISIVLMVIAVVWVITMFTFIKI